MISQEGESSSNKHPPTMTFMAMKGGWAKRKAVRPQLKGFEQEGKSTDIIKNSLFPGMANKVSSPEQFKIERICLYGWRRCGLA